MNHTTPPDPAAHSALLDGLARMLKMPSEALATAGTTVVGLDARSGSRQCSIYHNGSSTTLWCDPQIVGRVRDLLDGFDPATALTLDEVDLHLSSQASHQGRGLIHVLGASGVRRTPPLDGFATLVVDPDNSADMDVFARLVEVTPDDDLEAAEVEIDDPDPHIEILLDAAGQPVAYGSWILWGSVPSFVDIGVVTVPHRRRIGAGRAVVANVARAALVDGFHPLYRCDSANEASRRLAESVGFVSVYELSAWAFDDR